MKPIGFIYLTTNLVNGKIYIGRHEFNKHNKIYLGSGKIFKLALEKYGEENFKRKILRLCFTEHELTIWEHVYIKKYHSQDKNIGYNIASGNVNTSDYNPTKLPEVRKKISGKNHYFYGKKHTEETKEKIRKKLIGKNSPWYGKYHTEETKRKLSESHKNFYKTEKGKNVILRMSEKLKGRKMSEEQKEKIRIGNLGVKRSEETKKRMKESNSHYWKGKKFSEETRRKMSESHKKKNKNE